MHNYGIFISYSRDNKAIIKKLASDLKHARYIVWFDGDLSGGEDWWTRILSEVRRCDIFIFAVSQSSLKSSACMTELRYACALGKTVMPLRILKKPAPVEWPAQLNKTQEIDYINKDFRQVIQAFNSLDFKPNPLPDPLPPPPDAPESELTVLAEYLGKSAPISYDEQVHILSQLQNLLLDAKADKDAWKLLESFKKRSEISESVRHQAEKIKPPRIKKISEMVIAFVTASIVAILMLSDRAETWFYAIIVGFGVMLAWFIRKQDQWLGITIGGVIGYASTDLFNLVIDRILTGDLPLSLVSAFTLITGTLGMIMGAFAERLIKK